MVLGGLSLWSFLESGIASGKTKTQAYFLAGLFWACLGSSVAKLPLALQRHRSGGAGWSAVALTPLRAWGTESCSVVFHPLNTGDLQVARRAQSKECWQKSDFGHRPSSDLEEHADFDLPALSVSHKKSKQKPIQSEGETTSQQGEINSYWGYNTFDFMWLLSLFSLILYFFQLKNYFLYDIFRLLFLPSSLFQTLPTLPPNQTHALSFYLSLEYIQACEIIIMMMIIRKTL